MDGMTLCVGLAGAALVLFLSPRWGFVVYVATLLLYPSYLRITVFGCTVSVGRLVVMTLLVRCLLDEQLRRGFRWTRLDTLIIVADAVYMLVLSCSVADFFAGIKYQSGAMVDTTFAYFSARLIINNRAVLIHVVKVAAAILVVMALLGAYEAVTTATPYMGLLEHHFSVHGLASLGSKFEGQEVVMGHGHEVRWGLFRAQGPHPHPIIFGASFALLLSLVWKLFYHARWQSLRVPVCGAIVVGGASSVSSTPFTGLYAALAGLAFERAERWVKHLLVFAILSCIFLEFYTGRPHFYYVFLARLSIQSGTGYFRGGLIDAALRHLPEYWLTGYGFKDPGWGPEISGADYTDVTVHYVYLAVMYGVFGLLAYLAIVVKLLVSLWRRYRRSVETFDRDLCWALIVSIAVTLVLGLGVTPFGVLPALYSIIFGIGGSVVASPEFNRKYGMGDACDLLAASGR